MAKGRLTLALDSADDNSSEKARSWNTSKDILALVLQKAKGLSYRIVHGHGRHRPRDPLLGLLQHCPETLRLWRSEPASHLQGHD